MYSLRVVYTLKEAALSQEVIRSAECDIRQFILTRSRIKLEEVELHELIHFHNSGLVTTSVAVVGGREHSHHITLVSPVVPIHD